MQQCLAHLLLYFLMSGQMSDVGTCTLCDSSTPSTCQAWIGTWPCCLDTLKSNENPHFSAIRVSWSQHCRVWHVQIHPITTARLSVNFKHRHLDENITGSVWCDPLNGCEVLWWFLNDFWLEVSVRGMSCYLLAQWFKDLIGTFGPSFGKKGSSLERSQAAKHLWPVAFWRHLIWKYFHMDLRHNHLSDC